jgi:deoxycytidylate deaminase
MDDIYPNVEILLNYIKNNPICRSSCTHTHIAMLFNGSKRNPKIVSIGINEFNLNCRSPISDIITTHAEMNAIMNELRGDFTQRSIESFRRCKYNMFVTKQSKSGLFGSSRPCVNCAEKLYFFGINKIYWTDINGEIHDAKPSDIITQAIASSASRHFKKMPF